MLVIPITKGDFISECTSSEQAAKDGSQLATATQTPAQTPAQAPAQKLPEVFATPVTPARPTGK